MQYIIDLQKYNITEGSLGKPPYSLEQYNTAKANGDGIQAALNYASENGYSDVILPRGVYSVCYAYTKPVVVTPVIVLPSGITFNLNGSTIDVIYDSKNRSPFDTSNEAIYALRGAVFVTHKTRNAVLKNGEIIGDIYNRSFEEDAERKIEHTFGVQIKTLSYNIKVLDVVIHGFMGDALSGSTRDFESPLLTPAIGAAMPGRLNSDGTIENSDATKGMYYSPLIPINKELLATRCPYAPNTIQMQTSGGYTRIPPFGDNNFDVFVYDSNGSITRTTAISYLGYIVLSLNEVAIRVQFYNEEDGLDELPNQGYTFTAIASCMVEVRNCSIHNNHRGGISNMPDFTIIKNNQIYHNGLDSSIGAPLFHSVTRYQINCEDTYSKNITIENNNIYSGFNCILLSTDKATVRDNTISGHSTSAVTVYNSQDILIDNNTVNGRLFGLAKIAVKEGIQRYVKVVNNRCTSNLYGIDIQGIDDKPHVEMINNYLVCSFIRIKDMPNMRMIGNTIRQNQRVHNAGIVVENILECTDNKFYGANISKQTSRVINTKFSSGNYFEGLKTTSFPTDLKNISFPRGYYKDCVYQAASDNDSKYTYTYEDSTFENTTICGASSRTPSENFSTSTNVYKCKFIMDSNIGIRTYHFLGGLPNINLKECEIFFKEDGVFPVIVQGYNRQDSSQLFNIQAKNVQYSGVDDLSEYITARGEVEN